MNDMPRRGLWTIALGLAALWVFVVLYLGPRNRSSAGFGDVPVRYPASFDWTVNDLEGRPVSFERFKGKPVFLNIWATWCPPCVAEMPSIAALAKNASLKAKGVEFVCVAIDETAAPVKSFVAGKNWPMTVLHATSLPVGYQTNGIPATFAISPEGIVVGLVEGSNDWDQPGIVRFLEELSQPAAKLPDAMPVPMPPSAKSK